MNVLASLGEMASCVTGNGKGQMFKEMVSRVPWTFCNHFGIMTFRKQKISHELAFTPSQLSSGSRSLFCLPTSHNLRMCDLGISFIPSPVLLPERGAGIAPARFIHPPTSAFWGNRNPACLFRNSSRSPFPCTSKSHYQFLFLLSIYLYTQYCWYIWIVSK